jgi:hypothetical protein
MSSQDFEGKTPKKLLLMKNSRYAHFHVFACPVYIHVPDEKRTKLEPSSIKGVFVGYKLTTKLPRPTNLCSNTTKDSGEQRCEVCEGWIVLQVLGTFYRDLKRESCCC